MAGSVVSSDPSSALPRRRGSGSRSLTRWVVLAVVGVAAAVAFPLAPFAWQAFTHVAAHDGSVQVTRCTREWLAYFPAWRCTGDYEPGDSMTGDQPASDVLLQDPRHRAAGDRIWVEVAQDHRTAYPLSWHVKLLVPFAILAGLLLSCAALVLSFAPITARGFPTAKAGTAAAVASLLLLLPVTIWVLT